MRPPSTESFRSVEDLISMAKKPSQSIKESATMTWVITPEIVINLKYLDKNACYHVQNRYDKKESVTLSAAGALTLLGKWKKENFSLGGSSVINLEHPEKTLDCLLEDIGAYVRVVHEYSDLEGDEPLESYLKKLAQEVDAKIQSKPRNEDYRVWRLAIQLAIDNLSELGKVASSLTKYRPASRVDFRDFEWLGCTTYNFDPIPRV